MRIPRSLITVTATAAVVALALPSAAPARQAGGPVAATTAGQVRGDNTADFQEFLGVPYAAPPLRELRFAPPAAPTA